VIEGISLGVMIFLSMVVSFIKLPSRIRTFIKEHKLLTDFLAGAIVYMLLGAISKTVAAVWGAITCGLLVGLTLEAVNGNRTHSKRSSATS